MKKYQVTVNGEIFLVEVEELGGTEAPAAVKPVAVPAPKAPEKPFAPPRAPEPAAPPAQAGGETVSSPLPGTIVKVVVKDGQAVRAGELLLVLEAMKMENDILASCDGVVALAVKVGDTVQAGDLLASFT
ncbi:MAG: biotin/lipoyl-binding protein [Clostridiales bacterium]|nr:biotin/lipoyl-binding protein [Clostridiales bacterium]